MVIILKIRIWNRRRRDIYRRRIRRRRRAINANEQLMVVACE
jgi:hypothetical protein